MDNSELLVGKPEIAIRVQNMTNRRNTLNRTQLKPIPAGLKKSHEIEVRIGVGRSRISSTRCVTPTVDIADDKQQASDIKNVPQNRKKDGRRGSAGFSQNMFKVAMTKHQRFFEHSPRNEDYKYKLCKVTEYEAELDKENN